MKHRFRRKLLLLGGALLLALIACEALLRVARPVELVGYSRQPTIYEPAERTGYRYLPHAESRIHRNFEIDGPVITNSEGHHDIEHRPDRDAALRIAVVGDSFTAALHVPTAMTWPRLLERELCRSVAPDIQVLNLGLDGTGTTAHVEIVKSEMRKRPLDAVILAFCSNDVEDVSAGTFYREVSAGYVIAYRNAQHRERMLAHLERHRPAGAIRTLFDLSYLFRATSGHLFDNTLLRTNFVAPRHAGITDLQRFDPRETAERVNGAFRNLLELSNSGRPRIYVAPIPMKSAPGESSSALGDVLDPELYAKLRIFDTVHHTRAVCAERHLEYRDLFWNYDAHFNEEGNRVFALAVARALAPSVRRLLEE